ncbi:PIN domain-containing protein [Saccharopolyspora sp. NPDC002686]|uniref:PIN domain-containing protein n=1 Tax=Saccharopolyspora sp. NPDC002686 TaxID=3154541 RepID=UPI003325CC80
MTGFPALLDTCVLFPQYLCDSLLRLAVSGTYRPLWSSEILGELRRNVAEVVGEPAVDRRIANMRRVFPNAEVTGYEALTCKMTCDEKDRHVLAAAVRGGAAVIVTYNVRDFPASALVHYNVEAVHPDDFLLDQLDLYPRQTLDSLRRQVEAYRKPPQSVDALLAHFGTRCELPRFAAEARRHFHW